MNLIIVILMTAVLAPGPRSVPAGECRDGSAPQPAGNAGEAQKVFGAIDRIKAESRQPWSGPLREIEISESELNAYIACRIEREREEIMKVFRLKLFPGNKIEGMVRVDLRGQKAPSFLKPQMDIFFAADLAVSNQQIRVNLQKLFVGDEPIRLFVIDTIMAISSTLEKGKGKHKNKSLNDWYELPYGIKNVKVESGRALFYY